MNNKKLHNKKRSDSKRLAWWGIVIVAILTLPALTGAPWTESDYVFAGVVLFGCAATFEVLTRNMQQIIQKAIVAVGILFFILLVIAWAAA